MNPPSLRPPKARVFIVDDHPIVRRGFQLLLSLEPDLTICGEADSASTALGKILALKPDVAIVDLSLKCGNGLELIKQLRALKLDIKILVFTMRGETIHAERALRAGANGFITKEEGTEKAIEAIRMVLNNKTFISPALAERLLSRMSARITPLTGSKDSLSDREFEILEAIGQGLGSREIARKFNLSTKTVQSHREHMKTKLGLKNASELVNYAYNWVNQK